MSLAPGKFLAHVIGSNVSKDKNGVPLICLEIEAEEFGTKQKFWKYLSFAGGAKKYSLITLGICGFHGETLADLIGTDNFQPVEIEVVLEMMEDGKGGTKLGIKYINDPDSVQKGMTKDEAKLMNVNIAAEMAALNIHPRLCRVPKEEEIPFGG